MWLFHPLGFASVVADTANPDKLLARGRFKGDLEKLFPGCRVTVTPNHDYRFRAYVDRNTVADRIGDLVADINYPNFKNAAPKDRHSVYMRVWTALWSEQFERYNKRRRAKKKITRLSDHERYEQWFLDNRLIT